MKKKTLIALAVGAVAIIIIAAVLLIALQQGTSQSDYELKISQAEKYMRSGDYDKAIIAYKAALSLNRGDEAAYLGLYRAYIRTGRDSLAAEILRQGYDMTNSGTILLRMEENGITFEGSEQSGQSEQTGQTSQSGQNGSGDSNTSQQSDVVFLNETLLNFLSAADFADYDVRYSGTDCSVSGDVCTVAVPGLDASLRYEDSDSDRVIDRDRGRPYEGMVPDEITLGNVMTLFGGISSANYSDLRQIDGISSLERSGNEIRFYACGCNVTIQCDDNGNFTAGAAHTIYPTGVSSADQTETYELSGRVLNGNGGSGIEGVSMTAYLEGNSSNRVQATTSSNGAYWFMLEESGTYTIELRKDGYHSQTATVSITEESQIKDFIMERYVEPTTEPTTESTTAADIPCDLSGTVVDATSGNGVEGVELTIYPTDGSSGRQYVTTGAGGSYSVTVNAGHDYTIDAYKDGYISESFSVSIGETENFKQKDMTISPEMQSGEIRIVLTWGAQPADLDSHLEGTASDGTGFHCYYGNKRIRNSSGAEIVNLDVDDMSAYGPETTTITDINGVYNFYVKDYGHRGIMGSSSEATVKIYVGGSLMHTLTVPANAVNRWDVCRIDHGSIQIINSGS